MSTQSIATSASLQRLAQDLQNSYNEIREIEGRLNQRLHELEWRDDVAARFRGKYDQCIEQLDKVLMTAIEDFINHLNKEAEIISQYDSI